MQEVVDFIKECRIFYLATVEGDQPRVRPFGIVEIYNDRIYILTGKKKNVFKQIEKNNKVELCCAQDNKWLRIEGKLVLDDSVETKKYILDKNPYLRPMYDENDDNTAAMYFESGVATINTFTGAPKVIEF